MIEKKLPLQDSHRKQTDMDTWEDALCLLWCVNMFLSALLSLALQRFSRHRFKNCKQLSLVLGAFAAHLLGALKGRAADRKTSSARSRAFFLQGCPKDPKGHEKPLDRGHHPTQFL